MTMLPTTFWARVNRTETCWLWMGHVNKGGYGKTTHGDTVQYVHRLVYADAQGPIADGLVIDHKCHNRRCVNPDHLQAVTNRQNMQNRSGPQVNSRSGVRGVHWSPGSKKWRVQIRALGRNHNGGYFADLDAAAATAAALRASLMDNSLLDGS